MAKEHVRESYFHSFMVWLARIAENNKLMGKPDALNKMSDDELKSRGGNREDEVRRAVAGYYYV